jgi:hypothetical protein
MRVLACLHKIFCRQSIPSSSKDKKEGYIDADISGETYPSLSPPNFFLSASNISLTILGVCKIK